MTRSAIKLNPYQRVLLRSSLVALLVALTHACLWPIPTQAACSLWDRIRGRTCGSGGAGAAGVRDQTCLPPRDNRSNDDYAFAALVPGDKLYTGQATPELLFRIPIDRSTSNVLLMFDLAIQKTDISRQVVVGPMRLTPPPEKGLARFRFPIALEPGNVYTWSLRLICQQTEPAGGQPHPSGSSPNDPENVPSSINDIHIPRLTGYPRRVTLTVHQELYGLIQYVEDPTALVTVKARGRFPESMFDYVNYDAWRAHEEANQASNLPQQLPTLEPLCLYTLAWSAHTKRYEQVCSPQGVTGDETAALHG